MLPSWFHLKPTGDLGRDRNTRTIQFSCLLFAFALGITALVDVIAGESVPWPIILATLGLFAAATMNRAGRSVWAGRISVLVLMLGAILLVFEAHDGIRSHAMLVFPGLLLMSVMLLDRASYLTTASIVLLAVAALGIAEIHGFTQARPGIRTPTSYDSIFYVELILTVFALIGSRIANDVRSNLVDLRATIDQLSKANLELNESTEALRESEERFRRVFEEGPLGLALVGRDFRFEKVNSALCQMVGYEEGELTRMSFVDITHPDDLGADVGLAGKLFKCEIPFYRIQKRYVKKNGEIIWINLTASVVHDPDGETLYGIAMVEDITELKRTHDEALFRQKLESVGTLAGGIAHDFNNILGAIQAQADLALMELDGGSQCRKELNAIGEVAMRGAEIVRQLMIYSGKESAVIELVDLSAVVEEMLSLLKVSVNKRAVIEATLERDLPPIHASSAQLRQIVMNLITNASDATGDRDASIRVTTRRVARKGESVAISSARDGGYVQLEVSDSGSGMSAQTRAKVFDPFFTTKSAGRGLGLAVVQGIVRSLGGLISVSSELGKGTTFQILLPYVEATARANGQDAASPVHELSAPG